MGTYSLAGWLKSRIGVSQGTSGRNRRPVNYRPILEDLEERAVPTLNNPMYLFNCAGTLYFLDSDEDHGRELWKTDPETGTTSMVKDINPGVAGGWSETSDDPCFAEANGILFFTPWNYDNQMWRSDGTASGTYRVKDGVYGPGNDGTYIDGHSTNAINLNDTLYFAGSDNQTGGELWKSDGTASGTVVVKDINPGTGGSGPRRFIDFNGTLLFVANTDELWKSDGTEAGTVYVTDLAGTLGEWTVFDDAVYFTACAWNSPGGELWKTDGTEAGTELVKEMWASGLTAAGSTLFMRGYTDVESDYGLWKSDGTGSGTVLVKALYYLGDIEGAGDKVYFAGRALNDETYGIELWRSDGTASGTYGLSNFNEDLPGSAGIYGNGLLLPRLKYVEATNTVYFFADVKDETMMYSEIWLGSVVVSTDTITLHGQTGTGWLCYVPSDDEEENGWLFFCGWVWGLEL